MVLDMLDNCHIIPVTIIRDYRGTKVEWGGADVGPRRCHKGSIDYLSRPRGMNITVDPTSPKPIYKQVVDGVRMAIALGSLKAEDRLPAIREMAVKTRVHRNTIVRAYQELEHQGLLRGRQAPVSTLLTTEGSVSARCGGRPCWRRCMRSSWKRVWQT